MHTEVISLSNATLKAYIQDPSMDQRFPIIRPAIIIFPGGAYIGITEKEAEPVAMRFLSAGYHVFILRYSIGVGIAKFPAPFLDAARAMVHIHENARKWCVDTQHISLCGFSTGGHVAAVFASSWQQDYISEALKVEKSVLKPKALILCYPLLDLYQFQQKHSAKDSPMLPLIEMIFSATYGHINPIKESLAEWDCKNNLSQHMPPTFLWTTVEDALVDVDISLDFIKGLQSHKIPYEYHLFQKGAHGLSLGDTTVGYDQGEISEQINAHKWVELALNWLVHQ